MSSTIATKTIEAARQGDPESFRTIVRLYSPKVRGTLRQMVGIRHLDDQTQEVFIRVWRGLSKLRNGEGFSTWIYRITWNVAMDARKSYARERERHSDQDICDESFHGTLDGENGNREERVHNRMLVEKGLRELSSEHRDVLVLSDLEELPQDEVAQILSIPVGTVKSRLSASREKMRQFLRKKGAKV